jgi:hypothetical protein
MGIWRRLMGHTVGGEHFFQNKTLLPNRADLGLHLARCLSCKFTAKTPWAVKFSSYSPGPCWP